MYFLCRVLICTDYKVPNMPQKYLQNNPKIPANMAKKTSETWPQIAEYENQKIVSLSTFRTKTYRVPQNYQRPRQQKTDKPISFRSHPTPLLLSSRVSLSLSFLDRHCYLHVHIFLHPRYWSPPPSRCTTNLSCFTILFIVCQVSSLLFCLCVHRSLLILTCKFIRLPSYDPTSHHINSASQPIS